MEIHRLIDSGDRYPINTGQLVGLIKQQLDTDLDYNYTPFSISSSYRAPFRITYRQYSYTIVGKGTTSFR